MKFELHVTDADVSNGNISISWCLDKAGLDLLKDKDIKNPVVVLCIAPASDNAYDSKKEARRIVPLKDLIAYVDFRRAGKNNIWGFICEDMKLAKNKFLKKDDGDFYSDILNKEGDDYRSDRCRLSGFITGNKYLYNETAYCIVNKESDDYEKLKAQYLTSEPISVDVPKECFAPEPSELEKTWVNHFFSTKAIDQCNFRRRRIFAYSVQPFIIIVDVIIRLILVCISILFGLRSLDLKLLHPLRYDMATAFEVLNFNKGTIFIKKPTKLSHAFTDFIALPFMPVIIIIFYFLFRVQLIKALSFIVILFLICCCIIYVYDNVKEREQLAAPWYTEAEDIVVCGEMKPHKLSDLPAKYKTIKLRFQDLKAKICRPFSV